FYSIEEHAAAETHPRRRRDVAEAGHGYRGVSEIAGAHSRAERRAYPSRSPVTGIELLYSEVDIVTPIARGEYTARTRSSHRRAGTGGRSETQPAGSARVAIQFGPDLPRNQRDNKELPCRSL